MITEHQKANFETLKRAFQQGDVALMECFDKQERQTVAVICAVERGETVGFVPFAKFFNDNPYEQLVPPGEEQA